MLLGIFQVRESTEGPLRIMWFDADACGEIFLNCLVRFVEKAKVCRKAGRPEVQIEENGAGAREQSDGVRGPVVGHEAGDCSLVRVLYDDDKRKRKPKAFAMLNHAMHSSFPHLRAS